MIEKPRIKILIVDDHPLIRSGLAQLIEQEDDLSVCCEAENVAAALTMIKSATPDLAIVDISLPDVSGLELIKRLKAQGDKIKILVLSMYDDELMAERALRMGAMGYINKKEAADKVIEAIRVVLAGKVYVSPQITERLLRDFAAHQSSNEASPIERLTDRELVVFQMIGQGMNTMEIAERLHISDKTISTHRAHMKQKLSLESSAELNRYAFQWALDSVHQNNPDSSTNG